MRTLLNQRVLGMARVYQNTFHRCLQTGTVTQAVDKAQLGKLRKKTGFSFVNCKNALVKFDNDLVKAEKWLLEQSQKEGWTKASKLQNRPMSHGLVGVIVENNSAAMVELNCETDFVARNGKFQKLARLATNVVLQHGHQVNEDKILLQREELSKVSGGSDKPLSDVVAMEIGNIGENMLLRRAAYLRVEPDKKIGSYVHSAGVTVPKEGACSLGKYGALVTFSPSLDTSGRLPAEELGHQLCQHIVGMNSKSIGDPNDSPEQETDNENKLLFQEFLLDPEMTVGEMLKVNGTTIGDFVRFECGEEIEVQDQ